MKKSKSNLLFLHWLKHPFKLSDWDVCCVRRNCSWCCWETNHGWSNSYIKIMPETLMRTLFCLALYSLMITTCRDREKKNLKSAIKPYILFHIPYLGFHFSWGKESMKHWQNKQKIYKLIKSFTKLVYSNLNKNSLQAMGIHFTVCQCLKYLNRFTYRIFSVPLVRTIYFYSYIFWHQIYHTIKPINIALC